MNPDACPACLVVTRIVGPSREDELRGWATRVSEDAGEAEGFVAAIRFEQTGGLFHHVFRFRSAAELRAWEKTPRTRALMEEGDRFSTARRQEIDDRDPVAQLPAESDSPKWKRFLMTYAAVLPIALLVNAGLSALPWSLPPLLQSALSSLFLVAAMTWVVLPVVSRRLKPWVVRDERVQARVGN